MKYIFILVISSFISACNGDCMKVKDIEKKLFDKLSIGVDRNVANATLKEIDIKFSFDIHQNRYQASITEGCGSHEYIVVYIVFDSADKLSKIDVSKQYTSW